MSEIGANREAKLPVSYIGNLWKVGATCQCQMLMANGNAKHSRMLGRLGREWSLFINRGVGGRKKS